MPNRRPISCGSGSSTPDTRMNPNLNYAQAVAGRNSGRGIGIIEGRNLVEALDASGLLVDSPAWTQADRDALAKWAAAYLDWLLTSKNGLEEAGASNNHGTFYDAQVMRLALILNRTELAKSVAEEAKTKRIAVQIMPDGSQPFELKRTSSLGYSRFNLEALVNMAVMADRVGVDLWNHQLPDGRGIRKAFDFLLPYVGKTGEKWPYQQIKPIDPADFAGLLREAEVAYRDAKYARAIKDLGDLSQHRIQLLHPARTPVPDVGAIDRARILKAAKAALAVTPPTITRIPRETQRRRPQ